MEENKNKILNVPTLRFKNYEDNYREITLKDVCTLITKGTTPAKFSTNGINFIKIDSLNGNYVDNSKVTHINESIHNTLLSRSILEENDILLAIAGATVGKHCIIQKSNLPANTNQALAIIRLNKHLLPYYLLAFFDTNYLPSYIKLICAASAQPNLNLQQVGQIKLNIPTIQEQEKVCHFIQLLDKRIFVQNKIISKYETLIKGLCDKIFRHDKSVCLFDLVKCKASTLQENEVATYYNGKYNVFGASGIIASINKYQFEEDGILVLKDGSKAGRIQYAGGKYSVVGTSVVLIPNNAGDARYLYFAMQSIDFDKYKVGSGIPHIYFKDYSCERIYYPNPASRIRIAKALDAYETKVEIEKEMLSALQKQKAFLLQSMFI